MWEIINKKYIGGLFLLGILLGCQSELIQPAVQTVPIAVDKTQQKTTQITVHIRFPGDDHFSTQMIHCAEVTKFQLSIQGIGMNTPIYANGSDTNNLLTASADQPCVISATFSNVPVGNSRVLKVVGYNNTLNPIPGIVMMAPINVTAAAANTNITLTSTPAAQVINSLLSQNKKLLASQLNLTSLQSFMQNIYGTESDQNNFSGVHPLLIKTDNVAQDLIANGGNIGALNAGNASYVKASAGASGTITFDGAMTNVRLAAVILRDPTSKPQSFNLNSAGVPANTNFNVTGADSGTWNLDTVIAYSSPSKTAETIKRIPNIVAGTTGINANLTGTPHITNMSPLRGQAGDIITITGQNFTNITSVNFNGTSVTPSSSTSPFTVTIPTGVGIGPFNLIGNAGTKTISLDFGLFKWQYEASANVVTSPTLSPDGTQVYFTSVGGSDSLHAVNTTSGAQAWAPINLSASNSSSPAVAANGTIYVGAANGLHAFTSGGVSSWAPTFQPARPFRATPAIDSSGNIYVGSAEGGSSTFFSVSSSNTANWNFTTASATGFNSAAISADGTTVYVTDNKKLYARTASNGNAKWTFTLPDGVGFNALGSPAVSGNMVYIGGSVGTSVGKLFAIEDQGNTSNTSWVSTICADAIEASPAIGIDGRIYIGCNDGKLLGVASSNGNIDLVLANATPIRSTAAIGSDGTVYFGGDAGFLYAFSPQRKELRWKFPTGGRAVTSSPLLYSEHLYFGTANSATEGEFYKIQAQSNDLANSAWPKAHKNNRNSGG